MALAAYAEHDVLVFMGLVGGMSARDDLEVPEVEFGVFAAIADEDAPEHAAPGGGVVGLVVLGGDAGPGTVLGAMAVEAGLGGLGGFGYVGLGWGGPVAGAGWGYGGLFWHSG